MQEFEGYVNSVLDAVPAAAPVNDSNDMPLAMAYVENQKFRNLYEPERAFRAGTLFSELDKPFLGNRGVII